MRYFLPFIILINLYYLFSCNTQSNKKNKTESPEQVSTNITTKENLASGDTSFENKALDSIFKINEVQKLSKFVDSLSKHKRGVTMITLQKPGDQKKYFWIQVGYNNGVRFQPYYNFYVYPENFEIKFLDTMKSDSLISLSEWHKNEQKR